MKSDWIIMCFVLLAPLAWSSVRAMPLSNLLAGLQVQGSRGMSALKGAQLLMFGGDASRPIGLAYGLRGLPHAVRFVASPHSASPPVLRIT